MSHGLDFKSITRRYGEKIADKLFDDLDVIKSRVTRVEPIDYRYDPKMDRVTFCTGFHTVTFWLEKDPESPYCAYDYTSPGCHIQHFDHIDRLCNWLVEY